MFSNTELCQVLKLPELIIHYHEHQQEAGALSFVGFLKLHYFNGPPHDDNDMKLPFKTNCGSILALHHFSAPAPNFVNLPSASNFCISRNYDNEEEVYLPASFQNSIFQPPRHV